MDELNRGILRGWWLRCWGRHWPAEGQSWSAAPAAGAARAEADEGVDVRGCSSRSRAKGWWAGTSRISSWRDACGGTIRLEMHESVQPAGAPHEAVGTHKHSEIWLMQRGTATLYLNGTEHTMEAGDVGLCCAGDEHWIANKSDGEIAYFVVTVGPPE